MPIETLLPDADLNSTWTVYPSGSAFEAVNEGYGSPDTDDYIWATETELTQQLGLSTPTGDVGDLYWLRAWFVYKGDAGTEDTPALTLYLYDGASLVDSEVYNGDSSGQVILSLHDFDISALGDADDLRVYVKYTPSGGEAYDPPVEIEVLA